MERRQELKVLLKRWEGEFLRQWSRKPNQADIKEAPEEIRAQYREFWALQRRDGAGGESQKSQNSQKSQTATNDQQVEDSGFWGSHLNRAPKIPGKSRKTPTGISEIFGMKLKAKLGTAGKEPPLTPRRTRNPRKPPKISDSQNLPNPETPEPPKPPDLDAETLPSEKNPKNSPEFPDLLPHPEFPADSGRFRQLRRNVGRTLASLDPDWIRRCEEIPENPQEFPADFGNFGNFGKKRPRDGAGTTAAPAKLRRIPEISAREGEEEEKSQIGAAAAPNPGGKIRREEEEEEGKGKTTRRARAPAGNFVRLNLKRKTYSRASLKGKFLRKQVWRQKWRKKFRSGGDLCFRCGGKGHWASECREKDLGSFLDEIPKDEEKYLPTLEEVARRSNGDFIPEISDGSNTENSQLFQDSLDFLTPEFSPPSPPPPPMDPFYPPNPDGTIPDPPEEVLEALRTLGFDSFRPSQAEAIMRVLSGISTLLLLPTGSGKSLCYQLPAFLYHRRSPCITLVISPLVSLMDDQVSNIPSPLKAVCIHSNLTQSQREAAIQKVKSGQAQILLLSPESVTGSGFFSRFSRDFPPVAFVCLDEAHCISQWSHNFRPAYFRVCKVLRERLGVRCFLALTATATVATARDVAENLGIPKGTPNVGAFGIPENLRLSVSVEEDVDQAVLRILRQWNAENFGNSGDFGNSVIVYCKRRQESERLAELIQREFPDMPQNPGNKTGKGKAGQFQVAAAYHAGLSAPERRRIQRRFLRGDVGAVCATAALGLGLAPARLRGVLHAGGTGCAESFLQHCGRAGRDGRSARCHVCLRTEDQDYLELRRHIHENSVDFWVVKTLIQKVFAPCKCREIHGKIPENSQEFPKNSRICRGHERSLPVQELVQALDLREEGIQTLLCLLELHPGRLLQLFPPVPARCRIRIPGNSSERLREVAQGCPPLEFLLARGTSGISGISGNLGISGPLEFDAVALSDSMGWEWPRLRQSLNGIQGKGIQVEFWEFSFHFRAVGDLSGAELDSVSEFLNSRRLRHERAELRRLRRCFRMFHSVAREPPELQERRLRELLRDHFLKEEEEEEEEEEEGIPKEQEEEIRAEIRQLLAAHPEQEFTGRAVARIFHGIGSPRFPARDFGRDRRFWRRLLGREFRSLSRLASLEILAWR
ncbi:ATP-dependent DNA helicase Q4 isoform X2 [Taeniopygia guttata]|uniref:ATP-dependent DNA helicase Q4 isoform X2 n=1 Tax=Taeniopygia guttata TaxID=59729 RepID=UPI003BB8C849